ncbi:unnamed protein product [Miscanthus lutarioriparius]|uniref:RHOMBOID-like protein n=1 Tax=Miscanthus lutarioriparius TaxID=422564 RepID=A0A811Q8X1_9POAL|nr:unnamed protein product [Miscanthus lutarioriparius]
MGALDVPKVVHGRQGWRLITCMWLHAGVVHLLINMLCLVIIGIRLEQEFGFVRIGLVYLISGFGGSLMSALFIQSNVSVGASGALFGLIGSMLKRKQGGGAANAGAGDRGEPGAGLLPRVDNFAHIGGLISGFLLGFVFFIRPQFAWQRRVSAAAAEAPQPGGQPCTRRRRRCSAAGLGETQAQDVPLFRGYNANEHCPWCHYLSCVPTKRWRCDASPTTCTGTLQENTLTVVCAGGRNQTYVVASAADASQDRINDLCNQLCT